MATGSEQREAWPDGPERQGPLAGVRVLDLSRILAGPFATMLLADLGADVVKVEAPGRGDETRRWGPPFAEDGTAAYYFAANRGKRAVTLDLAHPEGASLAQRLAAAADVVVDNFMPGRMERFGLDRASIAAGNPSVITATITGFGRGNPYADRPGFDFLLQAMGGIMSVTGSADGPPTKVGVAIADLSTGLFATIGILAALNRRQRTGEGAAVEVSLLDTQVGMLGNQAMNWLIGGLEPGRLGNAHPSISPYESYATADEPLAIAAATDRQFADLAGALGRSDLVDDVRFATNRDRVAHHEELKALVEEALGTAGRAEWLARLHAAGVPVAPINTIPEVFADPVVAERSLVELDGVPQVRSPVRIDGRPLELTTPPPPMGRDTTAVLRALGCSDDDVARLRADGVV